MLGYPCTALFGLPSGVYFENAHNGTRSLAPHELTRLANGFP